MLYGAMNANCYNALTFQTTLKGVQREAGTIKRRVYQEIITDYRFKGDRYIENLVLWALLIESLVHV